MTVPEPVHRNALEPGYKLHWYTLDRVLGQGGFGITYLAHDTNLSQQVAIKEYLPVEFAVRDPDNTVHPNSTQHEELYRWGLERFVEEGRTLARFDHVSIVRVLAVFEDNNTAYLVMRYEEGMTLSDALRNRKTLDEDRLIGILLPLLDGLELVHAEGFIHRDIKPANIFLRVDGNPVLIDFGSARQALGLETRTLTTLVSPGYAPFEQYSNRSGEQGPWTDIYALAATMYRSVAGVSPPDAVHRSHRLHGDEPDPLVPAQELGRRRYSPEFLESIDWGLRFRRQDRPQSIALWRGTLGKGKALETWEATTVRAPSKAAQVLSATEQDAEVETKRIHDSGEPETEVIEAHEIERPRPIRRVIIAAALVLGIGVVGAFVLLSRQPGDAKAPFGAVDTLRNGHSAAPSNATTNAPEAASSNPQVERSKAEPDLAAMLRRARRHADAGRTLWPVGNNAFETYKAVLTRAPANLEANVGFRKLVEREVGAAVKAIAEKDFEKATIQLDRLIELVPNSDRLVELRERIKRASTP